jgi:peptide/nickel transport system ATP-binding protein
MAEQIQDLSSDQGASLAAAGVDLVTVRNLKMYFPITEGIFSRLSGYTKAVDDVSFSIRRGETLGLVGESGCGKTTVGRCLVRAYKPTEGEILYYEKPKSFGNGDLAKVVGEGKAIDLATLTGKSLRPLRREVRMIFQDPYSSLNPRMTVFENISEALKVGRVVRSRSAMEDRVGQLLGRVGLRPEYMVRYPHAFSGGERQRVVIARSLITNPRLIVADEAVSALDVSVRAQILNLMEELQGDFDLTYLFISHDLSVIRHICNRVIVMYVGKIVEVAEGMDIYIEPKHPYTEALMSAVPISNPLYRKRSERIRLEGEVPDPSNPPPGCYFHPRCRYAKDICGKEEPPLVPYNDQGHHVACHFAKDLDLRGAIMD